MHLKKQWKIISVSLQPETILWSESKWDYNTDTREEKGRNKIKRNWKGERKGEWEKETENEKDREMENERKRERDNLKNEWNTEKKEWNEEDINK